MLDLKRLQYLEAVYKYKNFTRASEALYVSQPAISTAINALEDELGVKLITRNSKKVVFTFEGEQFMHRVIRILNLCRETEYTMKDFANSVEQHLRFGISTAISYSIVPHIFSDFIKAYPRARIQLEEGAMNDHLLSIQNESLDLAYNGLPDPDDSAGFDVFPITEAKIYAVLNPGNPLSALEEIPLAALTKEKLIMMSVKSKVTAIMMKEFEKDNMSPNIVFSYDQILCMSNVVEACNYVGIISVVNGQPTIGLENLILRPIQRLPAFPVGFITKKGRYLPQIGRELIEFVKQLLQ